MEAEIGWTPTLRSEGIDVGDGGLFDGSWSKLGEEGTAMLCFTLENQHKK